MAVFAIKTIETEVREWSDEALVAAARAGEADAFVTIMRRNNQRLFRVARGIVRDASEAEDVVQETYMRAFARLGQLTDPRKLSAWLAKVAANEALGRMRKHARPGDVTVNEPLPFPVRGGDPETEVAQGEVRRMIEGAIDELSPEFRSVFVLRAVEEFSVAETADCLGVPADTVKSRFHRAKRDLRRALNDRLVSTMSDAYPFGGARCDRIVKQVLQRLR